jgi:formylglycine-generating enzyme required for sulfatase activity
LAGFLFRMAAPTFATLLLLLWLCDILNQHMGWNIPIGLGGISTTDDAKELASARAATPPADARTVVPVPNTATPPATLTTPRSNPTPAPAPDVETSGKAFAIPDLSLEMLWVKPGTFTMGSPTSEEGHDGDETQHQVTLTNGFYLGKYEVTQAQYEAVMTGNSNGLSATPSEWPNNPNRPVEKVSWNDVQVFLTRLNAAEQAAGRLPNGWSYVLPTESEWEYACRAGTTTAYSWGNSITASNANYNQSGIGQTRDVGQYAANPWGFFDMHGNVREWVANYYQAAYPSGSVIDPVGPAGGSGRVRRGGSWLSSANDARSADRYRDGLAASFYTLGFRLSLRPAKK